MRNFLEKSGLTRKDLENAARDAMWNSSCDAHCLKCGGFVATAEIDAGWTGGNGHIECPACGPGTKIASLARIGGYA